MLSKKEEAQGVQEEEKDKNNKTQNSKGHPQLQDSSRLSGKRALSEAGRAAFQKVN
jgi:hypothetical protein